MLSFFLLFHNCYYSLHYYFITVIIPFITILWIFSLLLYCHCLKLLSLSLPMHHDRHTTDMLPASLLKWPQPLWMFPEKCSHCLVMFHFVYYYYFFSFFYFLFLFYLFFFFYFFDFFFLCFFYFFFFSIFFLFLFLVLLILFLLAFLFHYFFFLLCLKIKLFFFGTISNRQTLQKSVHLRGSRYGATLECETPPQKKKKCPCTHQKVKKTESNHDPHWPVVRPENRTWTC